MGWVWKLVEASLGVGEIEEKLEEEDGVTGLGEDGDSVEHSIAAFVEDHNLEC